MWSVTKFDEIDSTNSELKRRVDAPHGTIVVASRQTAGRGRMGRSFSSPHGIYFSLLLRRNEPPTELFHLTAMVAVAVRRAIAEAACVQVQIKWVNDLLLENKKLCGILVEGGEDRYIIGIGINCNTVLSDLPEEVREIAAVLPCDEDQLLAALVKHLKKMDEVLFSQKEAWLAEYSENCLTIGKNVQIIRAETRTQAVAVGIDENAALLVRYPDGSTQAVSSGEASVRGLYGYV